MTSLKPGNFFDLSLCHVKLLLYLHLYTKCHKTLSPPYLCDVIYECSLISSEKSKRNRTALLLASSACSKCFQKYKTTKIKMDRKRPDNRWGKRAMIFHAQSTSWDNCKYTTATAPSILCLICSGITYELVPCFRYYRYCKHVTLKLRQVLNTHNPFSKVNCRS